MKTKEINPIYTNFIYEKKINQGLSDCTIRTYNTLFNHIDFTNILDTYKLDTFTLCNVKLFLGNLFIKNKWTSETYNRNKKNLKVFCDYLVSEGFILENPLFGFKDRKINKKLPKYLTRQQLKQIDNRIAVITKEYNLLNLRNRTLYNFYLYTGLRLNELVNIKIHDINYIDGYIRIEYGKGGKTRLVPLVEDLKEKLIDYYFELVKFDFKKGYLFPTRYGGQLQHRDIYNFFKHIKRGLNFNFTPHMLRHTFATELVKQNVNIYSISRVLGHSKLDISKL